MPVNAKSSKIVSFGDFQTPYSLAAEATEVLRNLGMRPAAILEPSCGKGSFVAAAAKTFSDAELIFGIDVNSEHLSVAKGLIRDDRVRLFEGDFFELNWSVILAQSIGPWLIVGNPPWVTNSALSALSSTNIPTKNNEKKLLGVEAITGKSNFDISEWMLLRYLEWLPKGSAFAVLCKVTVARKILLHSWENSVPVEYAKIFRINAQSHFDVAVEACLFVLKVGAAQAEPTCDVFDTLQSTAPSGFLSYVDGQITKNLSDFTRGRHLLGGEANYQWRSGVKHDCSRVMELRCSPNGYRNGLEELVDIEDNFVYPMYKSSALSSKPSLARKMLVPQHFPGEDLSQMHLIAPKTWAYLSQHRDLLRKRASSIYKKKGDFAIFGVGPYTFTPWKVAISGFYKRLIFTVVGPIEGRPVVFDDTVYFISCYSENEAQFMAGLLHSDIAQNLLESMIHWDNKRPITVDLLKQISLARIAKEVGLFPQYERFAKAADPASYSLGTYGLFQAS